MALTLDINEVSIKEIKFYIISMHKVQEQETVPQKFSSPCRANAVWFQKNQHFYFKIFMLLFSSEGEII